MKLKEYFLLSLITISLTLTSCKSKVGDETITPARQLYYQGLKALNAKKYKKAADEFEKIFFQHPGNEITPQAELMQAYSLYLAGQYDEAVDILEIFIKLHPRHKDVAYAYYLRALSNYVQISEVTLDQSRTRFAKENFEEVIARFPSTKYAQDARLKIDLVNDHLAGKEMLVGRYYLTKWRNPIAATAKMAGGHHQNINLAPKDTVIFSSKIIPGNEKKIFKLFNKFVKKKVEVITEQDHFVHVSGHPAVEELKEMYKLVRPKISIPVHGEPIHIHEHAKLSRAQGVPHSIEVENGSVVLIEEEQPKVISKVENGYLAVDGNYLLPDDSAIFKMRRRMSESGIVVASIVIDKKSKLMAEPMISAPGIFDPKEDIALLKSIKQDVVDNLTELHKKSRGLVLQDQIEANVRSSVRRAIKQEINKSPIIIVNSAEV